MLRSTSLIVRKSSTAYADWRKNSEGAVSLKNSALTRDCLRFAIKNAQIKRCLAKAGSVLEIKMLLLANSALDDDGNQYYNDAASGVTIVWSNHGSSARRWNFYDESTDYCDINTENEIDVMLMRGVIPVFVSCKNGAVDSNELYKLNTVADRFGSIYAKKSLQQPILARWVQEGKWIRSADVRKRWALSS